MRGKAGSPNRPLRRQTILLSPQPIQTIDKSIRPRPVAELLLPPAPRVVMWRNPALDPRAIVYDRLLAQKKKASPQQGHAMIPQSFEYLRPESVREAISLLQQHGDGAKILSGGQSLIPMMKMRLCWSTTKFSPKSAFQLSPRAAEVLTLSWNGKSAILLQLGWRRRSHSRNQEFARRRALG